MKKGFTLSEVLITLSIVGVVAVLTVPGVMKNYKNRLYTAQLQKVYGKVAEATQLAMNDDRVDFFSETKAAATSVCEDANKWETCTQGSKYFLNTYFKSVKQCNTADGKNPCTNPNGYPAISGSSSSFLSATHVTPYNCIQTVDGAVICMRDLPSQAIDNDWYPHIHVDVNGKETPDIAGRDFFSMNIMENGTIVDNDKNGDIKCRSLRENGCLREIINNGWKMEY